jgi:hypothetical protein
VFIIGKKRRIYWSVSRHGPVVLLLNVGWRKGRAFGSENSKVTRRDLFEYAAPCVVGLVLWGKDGFMTNFW